MIVEVVSLGSTSAVLTMMTSLAAIVARLVFAIIAGVALFMTVCALVFLAVLGSMVGFSRTVFALLIGRSITFLVVVTIPIPSPRSAVIVPVPRVVSAVVLTFIVIGFTLVLHHD